MINQLGNKIILYLSCTWMCLNCQLKLFIHSTDKEHKWKERNFYNAKVTKNFCKSTDNKIGNSMLAEYLNTHNYDNAAQILYVPDSVTDDMPVAVKKI